MAKKIKKRGNNLQRIREQLLLSKAELARKAGVSVLTIDRVEAGKSCRVDTKRKIILALGLKLSDKELVFGDQEIEEKELARLVATTAVAGGGSANRKG